MTTLHLPARPLAALRPAPQPPRRIALVHDFLYTYAGAERVLEQLVALYPAADLFSLFDFLPAAGRGFLQDKPVTTTFLQKLPGARRHHRLYCPLMPLAIETLDVSRYDLVISSSYLAAKGVLTRADQLHICYCHTPVRFAWDLQGQYLRQSGLVRGVKRLLANVLLHYLRMWDVHSANSVDAFVTNSDYVGRRVGKIYRRAATTIYPPVAVERLPLGSRKDDFYLTVSRMVPYKRIDLIVAAFARMPAKKLVVIGDGPEMKKIRRSAGANVTLLGQQPDAVLHDHLARARAFVFAAEEDFGIAPVEAMACGTPVIAFGRGGAVETVAEGQNGVLFPAQTVESLVEAVAAFEAAPPWDYAAIRRHAGQFSAGRFREEFGDFVAREWQAFAPVAGVRAAPAREA